MIQFSVAGKPAPQGSKRYVGRGKMIESSKKLEPWRELVSYTATQAMRDNNWSFIFSAPIRLTCDFYFARPKSHYRTGKKSNELKADAPQFVTTTPDVDKLLRAIMDSLTDVVWSDDAQVVTTLCEKRYAERGEFIGVLIIVMELED